MRCFICDSSNLVQVLSLGEQPPSDAFLRLEDLDKPEAKFPLDLFFCEVCALVQLGYVVDPDLLFRDYVYNTGTNNSLRSSFKELVERIITQYQLTAGDFVIDVGSNDGTLLENYLPHHIKVLGIDPSSSAALAKDKNVPTLIEYFNAETAGKALAEYGKAKVITATNVFAHVAALDSFMEGIVALLDDSGVFISESGYVIDMVEGMQYDSIYHEHLRYYSLTPLVTLFERFGMEIIDVERIPSHGGSIRVTAAKRGAYSQAANVDALLAEEKEKGYTSAQVYRDFADRVATTKTELLALISPLKQQGARIAGIGAPAKGNTLLNYCGLDAQTIEYLAEKSPLKIGRYSPGMHIPVVDEERLFAEQPEAALLLSWNLAAELIPKLREKGYQGKIIIPNPKPMLA